MNDQAKTKNYELVFELDRHRTCPTCRERTFHVRSDYPTTSREFSVLQTIWCTSCGSGYAENADLVIEKYYKSDYGAGRGDRSGSPKEFFAPDNRNGYFHRAWSHVRILKEVGANCRSVVDLGAGHGAFLHVCGAQDKLAIEPDDHCKPYLEYIGAKRVNINDLEERSLDLAYASHSIEHLTHKTLNSTVENLIGALRLGGHILVEVPPGMFTRCVYKGDNDPHTMFFSPEGIRKVLRRDDTVIVFNKCLAPNPWPIRNSPIYAPDEMDEFASDTRGAICVVAKKIR
ncbi:class I SAM-dependent methyltransferase [Roseibium algicola]|uniref:class I SAM-dependent methyltransferase n=1 Tax=Roseibium algicola TaxID=2857014 RepID=UPI0012EC7F97|nr:hypothetical protein [Roseibium aggregatum]